MAAQSSTLTLRLPDAMREALDEAARATRRSRSFLIKEALERHLSDVAAGQRGMPNTPMARLLAMKGAGARFTSYGSAEEADNTIQEFRRDE